MHYIMRPRRARPPAITVLLIACAFAAKPSFAVPSFARQTGVSCEGCHTIFPELTHFGRMFKANGYTLTSLPQVRDFAPGHEERLSLNQIPPLSLMMQVSDTSLGARIPDSSGKGDAQNHTEAFPQQLSLFYAGKIAPNLGVFGQLTYSNSSGTIQIDNTDIRFANLAVLPDDHSLIYGVSLNNSPTVQDLWNTTPAWTFPYATSNASVVPLAATAIDGTFAQTVAGLTGYVFWNEAAYAEVGVYRSANQGFTNPITGAAGPLDGTTSNVIDGVAPYWRVAYERNWDRNSLEVGAYGLTMNLFPGGTAAAPVPLTGVTNRFRDVALDAQYQYLGDVNIVTAAATQIHESQDLAASFADGASSNGRDDLTTFRLAATYYYRRKVGGTLSHFSTTGSADRLLYPVGTSSGVVTSANGMPNTKGWISEFDYVPWLNVKLQLQYTAYTEFNGGSLNYDGFGRKASDNNTLYLLAWLAY